MLETYASSGQACRWARASSSLRVLSFRPSYGAAQPRLLAVDNVVVVPVNKVVKVLITANDVLHAWALPAFGVKRDAMPGRVNETWFKAEREGTFYGQCSELCGIKHAFMPITVKVVSEEDYQEWLSEARVKFAKEEIKNDKLKLASK